MSIATSKIDKLHAWMLLGVFSYKQVIQSRVQLRTSYSTVVLYIRDRVVLGFLALKYHPKISLKFPS